MKSYSYWLIGSLSLILGIFLWWNIPEENSIFLFNNIEIPIPSELNIQEVNSGGKSNGYITDKNGKIIFTYEIGPIIIPQKTEEYYVNQELLHKQLAEDLQLDIDVPHPIHFEGLIKDSSNHYYSQFSMRMDTIKLPVYKSKDPPTLMIKELNDHFEVRMNYSEDLTNENNSALYVFEKNSPEIGLGLFVIQPDTLKLNYLNKIFHSISAKKQ